MVIVSYDVSTKSASGRKRLRKVAEACLNFGMRAQNSVFECQVEPADWEILKDQLLSIYKKEEDSFRFYYLGSNWQRRLERYGKEKNFSTNDSLII